MLRILGFTGTRRGLMTRQTAELQALLLRLRQRGATEFHHGDCVGADAAAHDIAKGLGYRVVIHPPLNDAARAYKHGDDVRAPAPYLERNRMIVRACDALIAAPAQREEQRRSGTWATVRFARTQARLLYMLWPSYPEGRT